MGEIVERENVQELHISLTGGLWRYETWGYPVVDAAPGAEVWAWFKEDTEDVDKNWKLLSNALSGLLCASFNFINPSNSISPEFSFRPRGIVKQQTVNSTFLRYSALPREIVCTENLTPWKKLLPCDSKAGLASLLNSGHIHNVRYHSLALHLRPICRDEGCSKPSLELVQTVSLVYDYGILGSKNWSFKRLFGQGILSTCPLADSSFIYVDVTSNSSKPFTLYPEPDGHATSVRGGYESFYAKYDSRVLPLNVAATYAEKQVYSVNLPPAIHANQYITGYGQEHGGIVTKIFNTHWNRLDVIVLQNIPWFVPVYLHTLKITSNGNALKPVSLKYKPGVLRKRPYYLEILLQLPARSVTTVSIEFDYVFLKWQEYPPDANHGFYIGSAVVSAYLPLAKNYTGLPQDATTIAQSFNASRSGYLVQVRTENMVITLPTPDFSMPYNVICLSCTVVALAFGPLHNITTKRLVLKAKSPETLLVRLKKKLVGIFKGKEGTDCKETKE